MPQEILKNNLIWYIDQDQPKDKPESEETIAIKKFLTEKFLCSGLSICFGAMFCLNQEKWWGKMLVIAANVKKTETLEEEFYLTETTKKVKLKDIFFQLLNFTVTCHGFKFLNEIHQYDILDPSSHCLEKPASKNSTKETIQRSFFELLDHSKNKSESEHKTSAPLKTITQRVIMSGCFKSNDLETLLEEKTIQNTICLIHNLGHTVCIGYKNSSWFLYDAEFDHRSEETLCIYTDKSNIIKKIFLWFGQSITLEIATFDANKKLAFPHYEEIKKSPDILNECGLHFLCEVNPEVLHQIVTAIDPQTAYGKAVQLKIIAAWFRFNLASGFNFMLENVPDIFDLFLSKIDILTPEGKQVINSLIKSLITNHSNTKEKTIMGLDLLLSYSEQAFDILLACFKYGETGTHLSTLLKNILAWIDANPISSKSFLKHLDADGNTFLSLLLMRSDFDIKNLKLISEKKTPLFFQKSSVTSLAQKLAATHSEVKVNSATRSDFSCQSSTEASKKPSGKS